MPFKAYIVYIQLYAGWWYTYPSEKYEFVSWDYCSQHMENKTRSKPPTSIWWPTYHITHETHINQQPAQQILTSNQSLWTVGLLGGVLLLRLQVGRRVLDSFLPSSMLLAITAKTLSSSSRSCSHACTCSVCFFRSGMNFRPGAEVLYRGQRTGMLRPKRRSSLYCSFQQWHSMLFHQTRKMLVGSQLPCYKSKGMAGNRHGSFCKGTILEYTAIPCHPMSLY